jgi:hypothetical protein
MRRVDKTATERALRREPLTTEAGPFIIFSNEGQIQISILLTSLQAGSESLSE